MANPIDDLAARIDSTIVQNHDHLVTGKTLHDAMSNIVSVLRGQGSYDIGNNYLPSNALNLTADQTAAGNKTLKALLLDGSTAVTQALTDSSTRIATTAAFKNYLPIAVEVFDVGQVQPLPSIAAGQGLSIRAAVQCIRTNGYATSIDTGGYRANGGALYQRVVPTGASPLMWRSADRFLPNSATVDAVNGGYWTLAVAA